ncbi:hypothetical protein Dimus_026771 [Dionaea muscipula]
MKRLTVALREDGEPRVMLGCRRSGRLSSPALSAASVKLGTAGVPVEEPLEVPVPVILSGGSEFHSDEGSDEFGDLLRDSSAECDSSDHDHVPVPCTVMSTPEMAMAMVEEPGVSVAVIPAQSGESQVRASCSRVLSDSPGVLTASVMSNATDSTVLVMDEVMVMGDEIVQEGDNLAAPFLIAGLGGDGVIEGGQQVPVVVGEAMRLPSTDGRQQRPPTPAGSSCPVTDERHIGSGGAAVMAGGCGERVFLVTGKDDRSGA